MKNELRFQNDRSLNQPISEFYFLAVFYSTKLYKLKSAYTLSYFTMY